MKKIFFTIAISCATYLSVYAQKVIQVTNPTDENREEVISIPYDSFAKHFGIDTVFSIRDKSSGQLLVHQLEKLGTTKAKNVLIQVKIAPNSNLQLTVNTEKATVLKSKTYARYVPERFDDFAWENDLVAFRMYGKALEGRSDDAQGMDYWAKRTEDLVINKWYRQNDYHKDHGEGMDYYAVGQTLGAGDLAIYYNDKIQFTKHYRQYQVLDNGPLRSSFRLTFEPQNIEGKMISLTKTISIDAGQQFNRIEVSLNNKNAKTTPVVIGVAKRNESNPKFDYDGSDKTLWYWEPDINDAGHTGVALFVPKAKVQFIPNNLKQYLLKTEVKNGNSFVYYNGAAWSKAGKITSANQWEDYVEDFAESIKKPLKIKLNK